MFAIFEDRNRQYTVKKGDVIAIDKMSDVSEGQEIEFDKILIFSDDNDKTVVGTPYLDKCSVKATIVEPLEKDGKVHVFKFKRRKNYKRMKGHRQKYTIVKIEEISA